MHSSVTLTISAAAVLVLPLMKAHADDLFTLVGSGETTLTFSELGTPDIPDSNVSPDYFYFQGTDPDRYNLPYTLNGQPEVTDEIDFFSTGGGLAIDGFGQNFIQQTGPVLFSGTTANPTFLLGTFDLTSIAPACTGSPFEGYCVTNDENYTLTISNGMATTPEPASLALLGTGILGGLGVLQRRRARA